MITFIIFTKIDKGFYGYVPWMAGSINLIIIRKHSNAFGAAMAIVFVLPIIRLILYLRTALVRSGFQQLAEWMFLIGLQAHSNILYTTQTKPPPMTHWLAISNRDNSAVTIEQNIWGVASRHINQIQKTKKGDTILVYVGQQVIDKEITLPPAITGCFEIVSDVYEDKTRVFTSPPKVSGGDEVFPLRVKLRPIEIFDPPMSFKPLIPKLAFITNKKQWSGHIRGQAMRTIPEGDYRYKMKALRRRGGEGTLTLQLSVGVGSGIY